MRTERVGWEMPHGVRALQRLLLMIDVAAAHLGVSASQSAGSEAMGFDLDSKFWVGLAFDEPNCLRFQTTQCRIDLAGARNLNKGAVVEADWAPGGFAWRCLAELDSEPVHFFCRSMVSQLQWLEGFLRECLELARRIELPP